MNKAKSVDCRVEPPKKRPIPWVPAKREDIASKHTHSGDDDDATRDVVRGEVHDARAFYCALEVECSSYAFC